LSRPIVQKIILFAFYHNVYQIQFNDMLESKVFYMKITTRKISLDKSWLIKSVPSTINIEIYKQLKPVTFSLGQMS